MSIIGDYPVKSLYTGLGHYIKFDGKIGYENIQILNR